MAEPYTSKGIEKLKTLEEIKVIAEAIKKQGKTIVSINGSFDIIHAGHAVLLKEAKVQGDILILGLNSDESIKAYKSKDRPINPQLARAEVLAAFEYVDYITIFDETVPMPFLEIIKPDIHVNGSEYGEDCIEAPTVKKNGGKIYIIKLKDGFSTTAMIDKIIKVYSKKND